MNLIKPYVMRKDLHHLSNEQKQYLLNKILKQIEVQTERVGCFWADDSYAITAIKRALEIKNEKDTYK